jgi:hypothetical protein
MGELMVELAGTILRSRRCSSRNLLDGGTISETSDDEVSLVLAKDFN